MDAEDSQEAIGSVDAVQMVLLYLKKNLHCLLYWFFVLILKICVFQLFLVVMGVETFLSCLCAKRFQAFLVCYLMSFCERLWKRFGSIDRFKYISNGEYDNPCCASWVHREIMRMCASVQGARRVRTHTSRAATSVWSYNICVIILCYKFDCLKCLV